MCAFVCTRDNGDCVNWAVSVPQCSPKATPLRGECQLVKKKYIYITFLYNTRVCVYVCVCACACF